VAIRAINPHFFIERNVCERIDVAFQVKVTMKQPNTTEEKFIRILEKGDFFGEKALQG
jgi:hypothetical protein